MTENWKSCLTHFKGDATINLFLTSRRGQANPSPIQGTGFTHLCNYDSTIHRAKGIPCRQESYFIPVKNCLAIVP
jgi:hypothetical protein